MVSPNYSANEKHRLIYTNGTLKSNKKPLTPQQQVNMMIRVPPWNGQWANIPTGSLKTCELPLTVWTATEKRDLTTFATSVVTDQPAHPCRLIRVYTVFHLVDGTLIKPRDNSFHLCVCISTQTHLDIQRMQLFHGPFPCPAAHLWCLT